MSKFNVGDVVTGIAGIGYTVTNEFALLQVETAFDNTFSAKLIAHQSPRVKDRVGSLYENLRYEDYNLATDDDKARITGTKSSGSKKTKKDCKSVHIGCLDIDVYKSGAVESNFTTDFRVISETDDKRVTVLKALADGWDKSKHTTIYDVPNVDLSVFDDMFGDKARKEITKKFMDFFVEYNFIPSIRFCNTLYFKLWKDGIKAGKKYTVDYFALCNSPYVESVRDKVKSPEYTMLLQRMMFTKIKSDNHVNQRLKIYYGPQGTGKTTKAVAESGNDAIIVCHSSVLPQDIFEDFDFKDGKPTFEGSILKKGIINGYTVVLDEISNLPFETLRFLQGILDGKKTFSYKGETINVHKDFKIIGTMNLMVNGMVFGMPEPLVDRCYDIEEFVLSGDQLLNILEA